MIADLFFVSSNHAEVLKFRRFTVCQVELDEHGFGCEARVMIFYQVDINCGELHHLMI